MKHIGISAGAHTGFAVWDDEKRKLTAVETLTISKALERVQELHNTASVKVYIEDARLRQWFGRLGVAKFCRAGFVRRDSSIWEQFCVDNKIPYRLIPANDNANKLSAIMFKCIAKWSGCSSRYARNAALLVFGISEDFDYGLYR